mmetsp:Transcript_7114/g.11170  ORF Transcript_7114/g.11170 Transcript_7114/m.11170 type:complete len:88 (-) Transcript_7114:8-271(-)
MAQFFTAPRIDSSHTLSFSPTLLFVLVHVLQASKEAAGVHHTNERIETNGIPIKSHRRRLIIITIINSAMSRVHRRKDLPMSLKPEI